MIESTDTWAARAGFILVGAPVQHGGGASIFFEFYLNVLNATQSHDVIGDHRRDVNIIGISTLLSIKLLLNSCQKSGSTHCI